MKNTIIKKMSLLIMFVLVVSLVVPSFGNNVEAKAKVQATYKTIVLANGERFVQHLDSADNLKVKWSSSNNKVATIDSTGTIISKSVGKCTITGKYKNKKYKSTVVVTKVKTLYEDEYIKITNGNMSQTNSTNIQALNIKIINKTNTKLSIRGLNIKCDNKTIFNKNKNTRIIADDCIITTSNYWGLSYYSLFSKDIEKIKKVSGSFEISGNGIININGTKSIKFDNKKIK